MLLKLFSAVAALTTLAGFLHTAEAQTTSTTPDGKCRYAVANWTTGSVSMLPTFDVGDVFWSICLSHAVHGRVDAPNSLDLAASAHNIRPGDILITHWPGRRGYSPLIKRLIAVPGDRVRVTRGVISLNGADVARERRPDWRGAESGASVVLEQWREALPNGASYDVVFHPNAGISPAENTKEFIVPPGSLFVLGNNRDNAVDTRFSVFGFLRFSDVVAVAAHGNSELERAVNQVILRQLVGTSLLPT